jgi:ankyrin repeat protein
MVKFLLSRGADPNAKAAYDRTPLSFAEGPAPSKEIADLLRQHGAEANHAQPADAGDRK